MKLNKIYFVGLFVVAHCSVVVAAEVDPLQAQISLHRALDWGTNGCVEGVSKALSDGADPNKIFKGLLPLYRAARKGNKDIVEVLLDHNAVVNAFDGQGWTALHGAANRHCHGFNQKGIDKQLAVMRLLLNHDASANVQDHFEQTPLHAVVERWGSKGLGAVQLLLAAGADVNARYSTDSVIRWSSMTQEEVDESVQNTWCVTPLSLAAQKRYENMVRVLLGAGADTSLIKSDATRAFVKKVEDDERARVQTLLALGFDFSESTKENVRKTAPVLSGSNKPLPDDLLKVVVDYTSDDLSKRWRIEHNASKS